MFYSDAYQDQFVANILGFKNSGFYLDIGSCGAYGSNNSAFFENLKWSGLCIESNSHWNSSYVDRSCEYLNTNALEINYLELFKQKSVPASLDYLSMDIDTLSFECLSKLPHEDYRFKVITIEHDYYLYGDKYRQKQRDLLAKFNYKLICSDVLVPPHIIQKENCAFEDWWVDPSFFKNEFLSQLECSNKYPSEIIESFKQ